MTQRKALVSDDLLYDQRLIQRHLKDGVYDDKAFNKILSNLPDDEENMQLLPVFEDEATEEDIENDSLPVLDTLTFTSG